MAEINNSLVLDAATDNLQQVMSFIEDCLKDRDISPKTEMHINMSVEEIFVNIAHYAYTEKTGKATINVSVTDDPAAITIIFKDSGIPYDPLAKKDPDVTLSAKERKIGGLGIYLVKKMMDEVVYKYENGQNVLIIKKHL